MTLPIIGVTTFIEGKSLRLPTNYGNAIEDAGGVPLILVKTEDDEKIKRQVEQIDGLILAGGNDVDPSLFNEGPHQHLGEIEPGRDAYEIGLIKHALKADKPILAICRGTQILNIAQGGTMFQDIYSQMDKDIYQHTQKAPVEYMAHFIDIDISSKLYEIMGNDRIRVNTFHHQANRTVGDGFKVTAKSDDGVIEAFESMSHDFVIGVQWHPECTYFVDEYSQKLFKRFIHVAAG